MLKKKECEDPIKKKKRQRKKKKREKRKSLKN